MKRARHLRDPQRACSMTHPGRRRAAPLHQAGSRWALHWKVCRINPATIFHVSEGAAGVSKAPAPSSSETNPGEPATPRGNSRGTAQMGVTAAVLRGDVGPAPLQPPRRDPPAARAPGTREQPPLCTAHHLHHPRAESPTAIPRRLVLLATSIAGGVRAARRGGRR